MQGLFISISDLLLSYFFGNISDEDRLILQDWAEKNSENRQVLLDLDNDETFSRLWKEFNAIDYDKHYLALRVKMEGLGASKEELKMLFGNQ